MTMEARQKQGLIIGLLVGIALFAFFYGTSHSPISFILIPIGALMGLAPQMLKAPSEDDDD